MNVVMWEHPATQANIATLRSRGVHVIEPDNGYLACGMTGSGRLAANEQIVARVMGRAAPDPGTARSNRACNGRTDAGTNSIQFVISATAPVERWDTPWLKARGTWVRM